MRKFEIGTALALAIFAIAVAMEANDVGVGLPGADFRPGFFPFWLATGLLVLAVLILLQHVRAALREEATTAIFHDRTAWTSVLKVLATSALMLLLVPLIGFYTSSIVFLFIYLRFVGKHRWPAVVVMSLGIPIGAYVVFERVLQILLPRGKYAIIPFLG